MRKVLLCAAFVAAALAVLPERVAAGKKDTPPPPWIEMEKGDVGVDPSDPFCSPYLCVQIAVAAQCETDTKVKSHKITARTWDQNKNDWAYPERYLYSGENTKETSYIFAGKEIITTGTWRVLIHKDSTWGKNILAGNTGVYVEVELWEHWSDTFSVAWDARTAVWWPIQQGCEPDATRPRFFEWALLTGGPKRPGRGPAPSR